MELPTAITVKKLKLAESRAVQTKLLLGGKCGDMVSIRPCAAEYEGKTFLGMIVGAVATTFAFDHNKETQELSLAFSGHNPAIFIPEKGTIVYGYESWWGKLKDEEQLRQITDEDIQNVWYVRALKQLTERHEDAST